MVNQVPRRAKFQPHQFDWVIHAGTLQSRLDSAMFLQHVWGFGEILWDVIMLNLELHSSVFTQPEGIEDQSYTCILTPGRRC